MKDTGFTWLEDQFFESSWDATSAIFQAMAASGRVGGGESTGKKVQQFLPSKSFNIEPENDRNSRRNHLFHGVCVIFGLKHVLHFRGVNENIPTEDRISFPLAPLEGVTPQDQRKVDAMAGHSENGALG